MATLDDKLLGEKLHYYCSSSEDEDEPVLQPAPENQDPRPRVGDGPNTGPKGVIKDWQRYKQLEAEKRAEADLEKMALAKKLNLSCRSAREDAEEKAREQEIDDEMNELMNDAFMQEYMQKRLEEMMKTVQPNKKFGEVIELKTDLHFLEAIEKEDKSCTVIILIHEDEVAGCDAMRGCIVCLAKKYPTVKFCQIYSSIAGLSKHFKVSGVPALLVYRSSQLISSFVRLTDQLGEDFFAPDVEDFLHEHGLLPNAEEMPKLIREAAPSNIRKSQNDDSDSD